MTYDGYDPPRPSTVFYISAQPWKPNPIFNTHATRPPASVLLLNHVKRRSQGEVEWRIMPAFSMAENLALAMRVYQGQGDGAWQTQEVRGVSEDGGGSGVEVEMQ